MNQKSTAKAWGGGLKNKLKTHCPKGHEYSEENTAWQRKDTGKSRICRACRKIANDKNHGKAMYK